MRTPVWDDDKSIKFAVLSEGDEWTKSAFVKITRDVTSKALERANERMSNVQYLHVDVPSKEECPFTLLEKAAMPNLRVLLIETCLREQFVVRVANGLRNNPQLEQLQLHLKRMSEQATISLFEALSSLPLTALYVTFRGNLSKDSVERFCTLLQQKRETLVSLELGSLPRKPGFVNGLVSKCLCGLQHLRVLRLYCRTLDSLPTQRYCEALEYMPRLATLKVAVHHLSPWTKFFSATFRPITAFEIHSSTGVGDSHLIDLIDALKRNTRLRTLKVNDDVFRGVLEPQFAEEGFLMSCVDTNTGSEVSRFKPVLKRNEARHAASKRACVVLIAARQNRGVLKWIAVDVVRMIAMWLWDTRNQIAWDQK